MSDIFISYVEEDVDVALRIALELEIVGYHTWCYSINNVPGLSYLKQVKKAIDRSSAIILLLSKKSVLSHQIHTEVIYTYENKKPIFPILVDMTFEEFEKAQPEWKMIIASASAISIVPEDIKGTVSYLIEGLKHLEILPTEISKTRISVIQSKLSVEESRERNRLQEEAQTKKEDRQNRTISNHISLRTNNGKSRFKSRIFLGIFLLILFFIALWIVKESSIYKEDTSQKKNNNPSIYFTIGFLHAKALWITINQITVCLKNEECMNDLLTKIDREGDKWYPQLYLERIKILASQAGFHWVEYLHNLEGLVGTKGIYNHLKKLQENGFYKNNYMREEFINNLAKQSEEFMNYAEKGISDEHILSMIFVGHQIGKIDIILETSENADYNDELIQACRIYLLSMFEGMNKVRSEEFHRVLSKFPGIQKRVKEITPQELKDFVTYIKQNYLLT